MRFALPVFLLVYSALAAAVEEAPGRQPPLYRVELIVFTHTGGTPDARLIDELDDYSALPDPLALAAAARRDTGEARSGSGTVSRADAERRDEPALPLPYTAVDDMSASMARAWRRLADSAAHRPLTWLSWYQPAVPNTRTPRIRVHDGEAIQTRRPDLSAEEIPAREVIAMSESGPVHFYRLDGSVRLRQRQFLHLDIDLSWREPAQSPLPGTQAADGDRGWRAHRLAQSRAIRRDRLEYFDSSWLGVLALITRFEQPEIQPPAGVEETESEFATGDDT